MSAAIVPPPGIISTQSNPLSNIMSTQHTNNYNLRASPSPQPFLPPSSNTRNSTRDRYSKQSNNNHLSQDSNQIIDGAAGTVPAVNTFESSNTSNNHRYDIQYLLSLRNTNIVILNNLLPDILKSTTSTPNAKWAHNNDSKQRHNSYRNDNESSSVNDRRWVDGDRDKWRSTRNEPKQDNRRYNALPKTYDESAVIEWADEIPSNEFNFDFSSAVLDRTKDMKQARKMGITILDQNNTVSDELGVFSSIGIESSTDMTINDLEAERLAYKQKLAADKERALEEMRNELAELQLDVQTTQSINNNSINQPANSKLANFLFMGGEDSKFGAFSNIKNKVNNNITQQTLPLADVSTQAVLQPSQSQPSIVPAKMGADAFFKMFAGSTSATTAQSQQSAVLHTTMPKQSPTIQPTQQSTAHQSAQQIPHNQPIPQLPQHFPQQYVVQQPHQSQSQSQPPIGMLQQQQAQHQLNQQRQQQLPPQYSPPSYNQPMQSGTTDDGDGINRLLNKARARKQAVQPHVPTMTPAAAAQRTPISYSNPSPSTAQYSMPYPQHQYNAPIHQPSAYNYGIPPQPNTYNNVPNQYNNTNINAYNYNSKPSTQQSYPAPMNAQPAAATQPKSNTNYTQQ